MAALSITTKTKASIELTDIVPITIRRSSEDMSPYVLEWAEMRRSATLTDFTIQLKDRSLPCHRIMLASASEYFKLLLTTNMVEKVECRVNVDYISGEVMERIVDFIYTGQMTIAKHLMMETLIAVDYLQIKELMTLCRKQCLDIVDYSSVLSWYNLSNHLRLADIQAVCRTMIAYSFKAVCNQYEFLELPYEEVTMFIQMARAELVRDNDLLECALQWINHDAENRNGKAKDLLKQLNLPGCSTEVIQRVVCKSASWLSNSHAASVFLLNAMMTQIGDKDSPEISEDDAPKHGVITVVGGNLTARASSPDGLPIVNRSCGFINSGNEVTEYATFPAYFQPYHSICQAEDSLVVTGGYQSHICSKFSSHNRCWIDINQMPVQRWTHASVFWKGRVLTIGGTVNGYPSNTVDCLDWKSGLWTKDMPHLPQLVLHPKVACLQNSVFVLEGGSHRLLQLHTDGQQWIDRAPLPGERVMSWVSSTAVDDRLYVAGCSSYDSIFATYYSSRDYWVIIAQTPLQYHCHGALVHHDRKFFLIGGKTTNVSEYDEDTEAWTNSPLTLPAPLRYHHAFALEGSSFPLACKLEGFVKYHYWDFRYYLNGLKNKGISNDELLDALMMWIGYEHIHRNTRLEELLTLVNLKRCSIKVLKKVYLENRAWLNEKARGSYMLLSQVSAYHTNSERSACVGFVGQAPMATDATCCSILTENNQVSRVTELPAVCRVSQSVCKADDSLIVTGGVLSSACYKFHLPSRSWHILPDMPERRWGHGSVFWRGWVLAIGGIVDLVKADTVACLGLASGNWRHMPKLLYSIECPKAVCMEGSVYVLDGHTRRLYELKADNTWWLNRAPLPGQGPIPWVSVTAMDERLFVAGRYLDTAPAAFSDGLFAIYTSSSNSWVLAQPPQCQHHNGLLIQHHQKLLLLGGCSTDIEEYEENSGTWTVTNYKLPGPLMHMQGWILDTRQIGSFTNK